MRGRRMDEEEEDDDVDLVSSHKEEKGTGKKANRSKHSETEQRRRLKINERFQVLMDLIPKNDQKRDKASFLLEVIQYIQFLQAKVDMYESWSPEPSKLVPRRNSIVPIESFIDQPQLLRNGSGQEDNYVVTPMLNNSQNSINSEAVEGVAYKSMGHNTLSANQLHQSCPLDPDFQFSLSRSQIWQNRRCTTESDIPRYSLNEEEMRIESGEASISDSYSQGLVNNLTRALRSSGVDLAQASISVQLDVGKRGDTGLPSAVHNAKDHFRINPTMTSHGLGSSCEPSDRAEKRPRTQ